VIKKVFLDTDIILDVALARTPFFAASKNVLAMAENNIIIGHTSSNVIANIYYILRKAGNDNNARIFIAHLIKFITIVTINHKNVLDALESRFSDFEDALQHYSAAGNQMEYIVTRNTDDYKYSDLKIFTPEDFIKLYQ
jgi:predicted nucleic acid-binding protein